MLKACMAKFEQHFRLRELLLSTGNRQLVEHTTKDSYWADGGDGSGRNQLGITLVQRKSPVSRFIEVGGTCSTGAVDQYLGVGLL
ncbi:unnamed protein product [Rotaria socialis]|nr:unnamed protein product [Rotaria socialis]